jgi:hypothetical protein
MVDPNGDATTARPIDEFGRLLDRLGTVILRALIARGSASDVYRGPGRAEFDRDPRPAPRVPPATRATFPFNFGTIRPSFRSRQGHTRYTRIGLSTSTYFLRKNHWTIQYDNVRDESSDTRAMSCLLVTSAGLGLSLYRLLPAQRQGGDDTAVVRAKLGNHPTPHRAVLGQPV